MPKIATNRRGIGRSTSLLGTTFSPEIKDIDLGSLDKTIDTYIDQRKEDADISARNIAEVGAIQDKLTGEKFDTEEQRLAYEEERQRLGLTDDVLSRSLDDLSDPYLQRQLSSKFKNLYESSTIKDIEEEKLMAKNFLAGVQKYKNMSPEIYAKALRDHQKYLDGEMSSKQLLAQTYAPMDLNKTIIEESQYNPDLLNARIGYDSNGNPILVDVTGQFQITENDIFKDQENNANYRTNVKARFGDDAFTEGTDDYTKYNSFKRNMAMYLVDTRMKQAQAAAAKAGKGKNSSFVFNDAVSRGATKESLQDNAIHLEGLAGKKSGYDYIIVDGDKEIIYKKPGQDGDVLFKVSKTAVEEGGYTFRNPETGEFTELNDETLEELGKFATPKVPGKRKSKKISRISGNYLETENEAVVKKLGLVPDNTVKVGVGEYKPIKESPGVVVSEDYVTVDESGFNSIVEQLGFDNVENFTDLKNKMKGKAEITDDGKLKIKLDQEEFKRVGQFTEKGSAYYIEGAFVDEETGAVKVPLVHFKNKENTAARSGTTNERDIVNR